MMRIFTPVKIQRLRSGLNPETWVPEASMLTTRPPKPSYLVCKYNHINNRDSELVPFVVCSFSVMTVISLEGVETNLKKNKGEMEWFEVMI